MKNVAFVIVTAIAVGLMGYLAYNKLNTANPMAEVSNSPAM